jgi:hypothetical protein
VKHRWEDLAQTYSGETQIGTVDIAATAKGKELAARYHVESTPTFLLYAPLPSRPRSCSLLRHRRLWRLPVL